MAQDNYDTYTDTVDSASRQPVTVTPHNANELPVIPKRIYVGTGGDVVLRGVGASADVTYKNVADGSYLNVRPSHIRATGTTASDIIAEC